MILKCELLFYFPQTFFFVLFHKLDIGGKHAFYCLQPFLKKKAKSLKLFTYFRILIYFIEVHTSIYNEKAYYLCVVQLKS